MSPEERAAIRDAAADLCGFSPGQLSDTTKLNGLTFGFIVRAMRSAYQSGEAAAFERAKEMARLAVRDVLFPLPTGGGDYAAPPGRDLKVSEAAAQIDERIRALRDEGAK